MAFKIEFTTFVTSPLKGVYYWHVCFDLMQTISTIWLAYKFTYRMLKPTHTFCVCVSRVIFSFVDSRRQTMPPMSNTLNLNTHFHQQLIIMCHHCGMQERFFISRIAFLIDNQFVFFCLVCLFLFFCVSLSHWNVSLPYSSNVRSY